MCSWCGTDHYANCFTGFALMRCYKKSLILSSPRIRWSLICVKHSVVQCSVLSLWQRFLRKKLQHFRRVKCLNTEELLAVNDKAEQIAQRQSKRVITKHSRSSTLYTDYPGNKRPQQPLPWDVNENANGDPIQTDEAFLQWVQWEERKYFVSSFSCH